MAAEFTIRDERDRQRAMDGLGKLNLAKPWTLTLVPLRKKRSMDQSALYHKWVGIVAQETGNTHDYIHEWAKAEFLPPIMAELNGRVREIRQSTTKLTVQEMSDYMTKFSAWAESDMGIFLPRPEDRGREEFMPKGAEKLGAC